MMQRQDTIFQKIYGLGKYRLSVPNMKVWTLKAQVMPALMFWHEDLRQARRAGWQRCVLWFYGWRACGASDRLES